MSEVSKELKKRYGFMPRGKSFRQFWRLSSVRAAPSFQRDEATQPLSVMTLVMRLRFRAMMHWSRGDAPQPLAMSFGLYGSGQKGL